MHIECLSKAFALLSSEYENFIITLFWVILILVPLSLHKQGTSKEIMERTRLDKFLRKGTEQNKKTIHKTENLLRLFV